MPSKNKLRFTVEIYNCIQSSYQDVYQTVRKGNIRTAKSFGKEHADGRGTCYRVRKDGKIIYDQGDE